MVPERRDPLPLKWLNNLLLLRYRITVIGRGNLPPGNAVIACNHVLHTDFRFHLKAITHSLRFLGLRDSTPWEAVNSLIRLFFRLTLGFVDKLTESFVVFMDKGRPMAPSVVNRLLGFLKRKHYLIIMSEGQVTREEAPHRFYRGIGWFAIRAGCPIVPIAVSLRKRGLLARSILYRIGRPILPPQGDQLPREKSFQYTELVNRQVEHLLHLNRCAQKVPARSVASG
jgi:1-acyl-sn-glycerol-3-phosphate acyltransferase